MKAISLFVLLASALSLYSQTADNTDRIILLTGVIIKGNVEAASDSKVQYEDPKDNNLLKTIEASKVFMIIYAGNETKFYGCSEVNSGTEIQSTIYNGDLIKGRLIAVTGQTGILIKIKDGNKELEINPQHFEFNEYSDLNALYKSKGAENISVWVKWKVTPTESYWDLVSFVLNE